VPPGAAGSVAGRPSATHGAEHPWEERVQRAAHPVAYRLLSRIRRPVVRIPGLGVVVTDAELLRGVLLDSAAFTKTGPGSPADLWTPVLGPSVLLNMEGDAHHALRRRIGPLFAPAYVTSLTTETIGASTARLTARLGAGQTVDVVAEARENAGRVISRLVGLEPDVIGAELFARVSSVTGFVRLARPRFTAAQIAHARGVLAELTQHARRAYREGSPDTVPGRMRELGLSEDEAMGAVGAFVLTGTETLVSYIPRMIALLADTGWLARLARDPGMTDAAVVEGLRVTTPSPVMLRSVARSGRVGTVDVRIGDRLILATFLADRAAGRFDPASNPAASLKQLWFGAGAHFCLGAPLAMAQISATLEAVLAAERTAPLVIGQRRVERGTLIPGYARLHLQRARAGGTA
jgi:cytochrome P450